MIYSWVIPQQRFHLLALGRQASDEIQAFFSSRPPGVVRALVMRHAMGSHNTYAGAGAVAGGWYKP